MTIVVPVEHGGISDFTRQFIFRAGIVITDAFHTEFGAVAPSLTLFFKLNRIGMAGKRRDEFFRKNHLDQFRVFKDTKVTDPVVLDEAVAIVADFHKRYGLRS